MRRLWVLSFFLVQSLFGTVYKPWYGQNLQLVSRFTEVLQHYHKFNFEHRNEEIKGYNYIGDFSLSLPFARWSAEAELWVADTRQRSFCVDSLKLTGRYMWLDEAVGDALNLTTGVSVTQTFGKAVKDIALYHHGKIAFDAHLAAGKEIEWSECWSSRAWGVFGIGKADVNPAWIWSELAWEQRSAYGNFFRVFANYRHGFGEHHHHVHNLWELNYRYLDLGARYTHRFDNFSELAFAYARRCCVKNGLSHMDVFMLQFLFPFGI